MTQQEKLQTLVQKAIEGGWDKDSLPSGDYINSIDHHPYEIMFNNGFAKALFGENEFTGLDLIIGGKDMFTGAKRTHYWQYYLQQAVISPDPIDYMYEAVFSK